MNKVDMQINIGGLEMSNPVTVASGTFAAGKEYQSVWQDMAQANPGLIRNQNFPALNTLGAVTTKGVSQIPWTGNDTPRITETASGMLNSIGLQNSGVEAFCAGDLTWLAMQDVPVIVNVCGHALDEYLPVIQRLEQEQAVSAYELNISCPNVDAGGMAFGIEPALTEEIVSRCRRATQRPLFVKLTPNVTNIVDIAKAAEAAGANAVSLVNTFTGMAIDAAKQSAVLPRKFGGLSGPAIKPLALYQVFQCYQAIRIPIIGMGGISTATDAVEFMLAGASAVAIGSANFADPLTAPKVIDGIEAYCIEHQIKKASYLTGALK
ncbi:dihydroorotate dehydrogenase B (NAD(+)), catalytic subunit [Actinomycetota bacterium]|nr:dihydroorotate dehydrogenase B (NAD(+)), catalytic subunit [Actinomycetota bacterium]